MSDFNCKNLICPVCGGALSGQGGSLICDKRHTYDIARQGYVNLLPVQQKHSLSPGDAPEMLAARRDFLDEGHYLAIFNDVLSQVNGYIADEAPVIVDAGCGEGYYTQKLLRECPRARVIGADISKAAVKMACSRNRDISWICATAAHLPIADGAADVITAVFSLVCEEEFARVLKDGGAVVEVTAGSNHLIELKRVIYDDVFEQHKRPKPTEGLLREVSCERHSFGMRLDNAQLRRLLRMTPHTMRIREENRARLEATPSLDLTAEYFVRTMQK